MLVNTKFAAVAHVAEGKFWRATENFVKYIIVEEATLRLMLSVKQGQNLVPKKSGYKRASQ